MESRNGRPWDLKNPIKRLAKATGLSETTIHNATKEDDPVQDVVKSIHEDFVRKSKSDAMKLDDFDEGLVRRTIHGMYEKKKFVTMSKLHAAMKEKDIDVSLSTIVRTVKKLGLREKKVAVFPFRQYKEWTFFPLVTDPEKQFQFMKKFIPRKTDILLCTPPKTGTHWVHEIMSMLLSQSTNYNTKGNFIDMIMEFIQNPAEIEAITDQRIFHSHLPISFLSTEMLKRGNKIVYVNRNPKDRHVSMYNFLKAMIGFPAEWMWNDYFDNLVLNDTMCTGWFHHTKEMADALRSKSANILPIMYEDLLQDTKVQVTKLAEFLEVPYTSEFIDDVIEKCTFTNLKQHKIDASAVSVADGRSIVFRKGVIGDWKNWFTVAQNEQFDKIYRKEMAGYDIDFISEPAT